MKKIRDLKNYTFLNDILKQTLTLKFHYIKYLYKKIEQ